MQVVTKYFLIYELRVKGEKNIKLNGNALQKLLLCGEPVFLSAGILV